MKYKQYYLFQEYLNSMYLNLTKNLIYIWPKKLYLSFTHQIIGYLSSK